MPRKIRPIRVEGNLAFVPLTQGYEAVIDPADVAQVASFNWCALIKPRAVYAVRIDRSGPKQRTVRMHRAIMDAPDGLEVDHRDGDGLNNRRGNLRLATKSQNQCNARSRKNSSSNLKGVTWHKASGRWQSRIKLGAKERYLGLYDTPDAAHAAYAQASTELHGEFGRTT